MKSAASLSERGRPSRAARSGFLSLLTWQATQLHAAGVVAGYVVGWGFNVAGEATGTPSYPSSNATVVATSQPSATGTVAVAGQTLSNIVAVSAGYLHSLALRSDGTVVGWGYNTFGQSVGYTNEPPYRASGEVRIEGKVLNNVVAITADRNFSLALKANGTLATWGENYVPFWATNVAGIAGEWGYAWVLRKDGTVVGWMNEPSSPSHHQILEQPGLSNVVAISVGPGGNGRRGVALNRDGTVDCWGTETIYKDATPPAGLTNVAAVAAGHGHSLALLHDGTVIGWGFNKAGEATGAPTIKDPHIASGPVRIGGRTLEGVQSIAANEGYSLALRKDGTVVAWGRTVDELHRPTVPEGLSNVVAVAAGWNYCLAITTNAAVAERFRPPAN